MRLQTLAIFGLTLAGFALRLRYLTTSHPFFDEYTTVLAARQILRFGWPVLPSGLFYEHGLLSTYLIAPFTALFITQPPAQWQPAHWGLMLSRWPSAIAGTLTIPLIYAIGRKALFPPSFPSSLLPASLPLLAAGLFALSPEGMVWGGRARMYALATLLVLLTVYWAYRGAAQPAPARYRWLALLTLLATLLTQFGALMLVPALVAAMVIVGWVSFQVSRPTSHIPRPWFLRPSILPEGAALAAVIGLAVFVKRLGRPVGFDPLAENDSGSIMAELFKTVSYQTAFHFTWADTLEFLARQFGVPHHFWLSIATLVGATIGLIVHLRRRKFSKPQLLITNYQSPNYFIPFLWLTFGLIIIEMVTLLEPFRRNPRYIVMYLPLFYLIAACAIFNFRYILTALASYIPNFTPYALRNTQRACTIASLLLLSLFTALGFNDLRIALLTPEPAYEQAFAHIRAHWQPGDALLTMNTPAAGLYLGHVDGFTVQNEADQFLLNASTAPVDRWLGAPWLGTAANFNAALNHSPRAWFVTDTIRQPVYFKGNWQAVINSQMEQVWAGDNVVVYRTRPNRVPLPGQPDTAINAMLGNSTQLVGYTLNNATTQNLTLNLTLFWKALAALPADYTVFLHLRNQQGHTVAQRDSQPLNGAYPTGYWQPGETVIDPITLPLPPNLPAGTYTLYAGLYRLDTLERLPVANDTTGENAILLGEVTLP